MASRNSTHRSLPDPEAPRSQSFEPQGSNPDDFSYAFQLNSSQASAHSDEKASDDKFAHTRAKRKRTSRADQAILEAEYQRNSRPDKPTRSRIVSLVSLSDKEVQIWFQNRRQMTRRKCRTWQPNEITSIIRSSQESRDEIPANRVPPSIRLQDLPTSSNDANIASEWSSPSSSQDEVPSTRPSAAKINAVIDTNYVPSGSIADSSESVEGRNSPSIDTIVSSQTEVPSTGYLPSPAEHPSLHPAVTEAPRDDKRALAISIEPETRPALPGAAADVTQLRKKSSSVRLSMSLEGKAKVIVGGGTPSPPKKSQSRPLGLQRSQSLMSIASQASSMIDDGSMQWRRSRTHGRSRDARTWEFYCDSDARNSLAKAAELDQKGSASGVIGLIRSGSGSRKPLTPVARENMQLKRADGLKRKGLGGHESTKPKLARTASSVARLQTTYREEKQHSKPELEIWEDPTGDSDKENWEPGTDGSQRNRQADRPATSQRDALRENTSIMSHSNSLGAMMEKDPRLSAPRKRHLQADEQENCETMDEEVAAFMGSAKGAREEDEMDAVQNLLSLRKGAWIR